MANFYSSALKLALCRYQHFLNPKIAVRLHFCYFGVYVQAVSLSAGIEPMEPGIEISFVLRMFYGCSKDDYDLSVLLRIYFLIKHYVCGIGKVEL